MLHQPLRAVGPVAVDPADPAPAPGPAAVAVAGLEPLGHRPALDGLRAVAIALVVGFHLEIAGQRVVPGGFLGVDVFFVLSGFLITSLLLDEAGRTGGIGLRTFWARRVARLVPLLLVLLAFGAAARWIHPIAGTQAPTPLGFLAILGYVGNWLVVTGHPSLGSFQYVWSLAVEEQFYVLWPVLVLGLVVWSRDLRRVRDRLAFLSLGGAAGAMVGRALWWSGVLRWRPHGPSTALAATAALTAHRLHGWDGWYFNTGLRADGLLLGAALAATRHRWAPRIVARRAATVLGGVAFTLVGLLVAGSTLYDDDVPRWGLALLVIATSLLTAALVGAPADPLARALSARPLVWLGQRSYAIYLLHLPVILFVQSVLRERPDAVQAGLAVALLLAMGHLAHRVVERPAQRWLRRRLQADRAPALGGGGGISGAGRRPG